jgi:hypothetical protein
VHIDAPATGQTYDVYMALIRWLQEAREDLWSGCRRLTRDLDATAAVVLVLACGIGLSVAMFAVADTVLRRPLPVRDQERIVVLWGEAGGSMRTLPLTPQHFERFRRGSPNAAGGCRDAQY